MVTGPFCGRSARAITFGRTIFTCTTRFFTRNGAAACTGSAGQYVGGGGGGAPKPPEPAGLWPRRNCQMPASLAKALPIIESPARQTTRRDARRILVLGIKGQSRGGRSPERLHVRADCGDKDLRSPNGHYCAYLKSGAFFSSSRLRFKIA